MDDQTAEAALALADLSLKFAAVDRVTMWQDGKTWESDTDHTVMLGLISCAVAAKCDPSLDIGKIAQFAFVHDLVEAYADDTNTFGVVSEDAWKEKEVREAAALERIEKELADLPWVAATIHEYESLATPEARFIKTIDKCMPKTTRLLNHGAHYADPQQFLTHCDHQYKKILASYGADQKIALELFEYLKKKTYAMLLAKARAS